MKYKNLLKGLEITEIRYAAVKQGAETLRLDSEYYAKDYIGIEKFIRVNSDKFSKFSSLGVTVDCSAFYPGVVELYNKGEFPFIRVQNVKNFIDYDGCVCLPPLLDTRYKTLKKVKIGDIVITKGGTIGLVGYITKDAYVSRDMIFINSSTLNEEERVYLYLYLSTPFVYKQLIRTSSQCAQPHLTITLVKNLDILTSNHDLQKKCYNLYRDAQTLLKKSEELYKSAENILNIELNVSDGRSEVLQVNTKKISDTFILTGRLDAEYYLPTYESIVNLINEYECGYRLLKDCCTICDENYKPLPSLSYRYVELANIGKFGDIKDVSEMEGRYLPSRARRLVHTGDIIVSSIEGSLESCAMITSEYNNTLCSTGFYVVNSNYINSETLLILFKSQIVQKLMKKGCSGTILAAISKSEFERIPIPIINKNVQSQIAEKVRESFRLRRESAKLLQSAKDMVEEEIESMIHKGTT